MKKLFLISVCFILLKLFGIINLSWWLVLLPIWAIIIPAIIYSLGIIIYLDTGDNP